MYLLVGSSSLWQRLSQIHGPVYQVYKNNFDKILITRRFYYLEEE